MNSIIKLSIVFALLFASQVQSAPPTKAPNKGDATKQIASLDKPCASQVQSAPPTKAPNKGDATTKIASLDKPCGGPRNRQCEEGLYCVKIRDCPTEPCKLRDVTHICKGSPGDDINAKLKNGTKHTGNKRNGQFQNGTKPNGKNRNGQVQNGTKPNGNNTDSKPIAKGSRGNCKIAVIADQSFAQSHGKDAEQAVKDIVNGASDIINAEFGITISIESLDIKNGLSRRASKSSSKGPERERVNDYFKNEGGKIPNRENLCFVLGLTAIVVPGVGGWSPVGAPCKGLHMVVRNDGTKPNSKTQGVQTFTHEIGHMLGAVHDEDTSCEGNEEIMGSSGQGHGETVKFSQCSKDAITPKLREYQCLYN